MKTKRKPGGRSAAQRLAHGEELDLGLGDFGHRIGARHDAAAGEQPGAAAVLQFADQFQCRLGWRPAHRGRRVERMDKDFEIIADVTGQPLEPLNIGTGSPAGS